MQAAAPHLPWSKDGHPARPAPRPGVNPGNARSSLLTSHQRRLEMLHDSGSLHASRRTQVRSPLQQHALCEKTNAQQVPPSVSDTSLPCSGPPTQNFSKEIIRKHAGEPGQQEHCSPCPPGYPHPSQDFPGWQQGKQPLPCSGFGKVSGSLGSGGDARREGYRLGTTQAAPVTGSLVQ